MAVYQTRYPSPVWCCCSDVPTLDKVNTSATLTAFTRNTVQQLNNVISQYHALLCLRR